MKQVFVKCVNGNNKRTVTIHPKRIYFEILILRVWEHKRIKEVSV